MNTENVNLILSYTTILGQVILILILGLLLFFKKSKLLSFWGNNGIRFSFLIALFSMLGSLFYSEIIGYPPCTLCWYQRIFMYSSVFLLGTALWKGGERHIIDYSIVFSIIGGILAGFNYYLQIMGSGPISCSAIGYSIDCSERFFLNLGYITIPMMSLTAFGLIIVLMLAKKIKNIKL